MSNILNRHLLVTYAFPAQREEKSPQKSLNPEKATKIEQKLWSFRDKKMLFVAKMRAERDLIGENRDNLGIT